MQPLWKEVWRFLRKLGMELAFDPAIPLLGLHPKDLKSANSVTQPHQYLFIAAQLATAKLWSQPSCPSTDEWIKKMWNIIQL